MLLHSDLATVPSINIWLEAKLGWFVTSVITLTEGDGRGLAEVTMANSLNRSNYSLVYFHHSSEMRLYMFSSFELP